MTKIMIPEELVEYYVKIGDITQDEINFRGPASDLANKPDGFPGHIKIAVVEMSREEISARGLGDKIGTVEDIVLHDRLNPIRKGLDFLGLGWCYKK
ncbi:hypothetical protein FLAG1_11918 [Fusarium langsethiae]|uniref:Uncharacterized protein n=1 Tax=Fusarium langsethiae TaxID=179993 RepID=A0A0M9EL99_FUSLA|nr:hypothetical protein FLAG1_11918 [Fusarium langsethiae]